MYEFILWSCLLSAPNCPVYNSVNHIVLVFPTPSRDACEEMWKESLEIPDREGVKSYHKCEPVNEDL